MIFLLASALACYVVSAGKNQGTGNGLCVRIIDFVPNDSYIQNLQPDCDMSANTDYYNDMPCDGDKHDWFVEVWLNDGDPKMETSKQRSHVIDNTNYPVWDEEFCWQVETALTLTIRLYDNEIWEDDNLANWEAEATALIQPMSKNTRKDLPKKGKIPHIGANLQVKGFEGTRVGTIQYDYTPNVNWVPTNEDDCSAETLYIEVTEPKDLLKVPDSTWINGPKGALTNPNDPRGYQIGGELFRANRTLNVDVCAPIEPQWVDLYNGKIALVTAYQRISDCDLETMMLHLQNAGAVAVIYATYMDSIYSHDYLDNDRVKATIPGRIVSYQYYHVEFESIVLTHGYYDLFAKFTCPFAYEQRAIQEVCVTENFWFGGRYNLLQVEDDQGDMQYVDINNHAVYVSDTSDGSAPTYIMMKKDMGIYNWVFTPSLSGNSLMAECAESNFYGKTVEINACLYWKIYDPLYEAMIDYLDTIVDLCLPDFGELNGCPHSAVSFQITNGRGNSTIERSYDTVMALFGPAKYDTGELDIVIMGGPNNMACEDFDPPFSGQTNQPVDTLGRPVDVAGKLVMVFRGKCYFSEKHRIVSDMGAAAMLLVNYEDRGPLFMSASGTVLIGTIPLRQFQRDGNFNMIKDNAERLPVGQYLRGGFLCNEGVDIPATLCVNHRTTYSDSEGLYNDFHGTYHREPFDINGHAVYRLDPLTNTELTAAGGTPTTGQKRVQHTHTYMYYDQIGISDTGYCNSCNSWNIGAQLNSGTDHVYAYCVGGIDQDISSPEKCNYWDSYFPEYDSWWWVNQYNDTLVNRGQCPEDGSTGSMGTYRDVQGIFCQSNSDCEGFEYCMDCAKCLNMYNSKGRNGMPWADDYEHPCGFCLDQRDLNSRQDDAVCMPAISCKTSSTMAAIGTTPAPVTPTCTNICAHEGLDLDGCPAEAGCDSGCMDAFGQMTMSMIGDGNCDSQCWGCQEWQGTGFFDAGDCKDRVAQFLNPGAQFSGMLDCWFNATTWGANKVVQNITLDVLSVQGARVDLRYSSMVAYGDWDQNEYDLSGITDRRYSVVEYPDNTLDAVYIRDEQSGWGINDFSGRIRGEVDRIGQKMYIPFFMYDNYDELVCLPMTLYKTQVGTAIAPVTGRPTDVVGPVDCDGRECTGYPLMDLCYALDKVGCEGETGALHQCLSTKNKKKERICMYLPSVTPNPPTKCFKEINTKNGVMNVKVKGSKWKQRYRADRAKDMTACECRNLCLSNYMTKGPFHVFYLDKTIKNKKGGGNKDRVEYVTNCNCFTTIKKLKLVEIDNTGTRGGDVVEGSIDAWFG